MQKATISVREAAPILNMAKRTLEHALKTGQLPFGMAFKQASGKYKYTIPRDAFERFMRGEGSDPQKTTQ